MHLLLVEDDRGIVSAASSPEGGARFEARIPLAG